MARDIDAHRTRATDSENHHAARPMTGARSTGSRDNARSGHSRLGIRIAFRGLVITLLAAGCATVDVPRPQPPDVQRVSAPQSEYRVKLQRWEVGDTFRYTLEQFNQTTLGEQVE